MASGVDMLINAIVKSAGLDPDQVRKQITDFGNIVVAFKGQLDRIEAQNLAIMRHLEITPENNDGSAGRDAPNGSAPERITHG